MADIVETVRTLLANQYEAVFRSLNACIDGCPEAAWDAPVANHAFCQVVFHTLFYADYYLGADADSFRQQPFHLENRSFFRDYEELEDRKPVLLYDRPSLEKYLSHCRDKAAAVMATETAASLAAPAAFERRDFSRAELHVYTIRHIQHHVAQLTLRLRIDGTADIPWFGSG